MKTVVDQFTSGENPPDESELILDTTLLELSHRDNDFEVLSQRVDDKIESGLVGTLELFENKVSSAINELKVVVSSSIADSLKTKVLMVVVKANLVVQGCVSQLRKA